MNAVVERARAVEELRVLARACRGRAAASAQSTERVRRRLGKSPTQGASERVSGAVEWEGES